MSSYQPNIPTGLVFLDQDYANIQQNFSALDTYFGENHVPFSVSALGTPSGYHTEINMVPFSTVATNPATNYNATTGLPLGVPAATAGFGQVFSAQVNDGLATDQSLFYISGEGRAVALTRNLVPVLAGNGYTFLPGGLILQWGSITSTANTFTTLTFSTANIAFPNNCFTIFTQPFGSGTPPASGRTATIEIRKSTISKNKFEWCFVTSSSEYTGFFWVAIGN